MEKRLCKTPGCDNTPNQGKVCGKCRSKAYRKKYPIKSAYDNLKHNAKRRGKEFTLTFEEFKSFCIKTKYIKGKGRSKDSYHIDRIDETQGYHIWNIQVLTNSENVKKRLTWFYNERGEADYFRVETDRPAPPTAEDEEDLPF